VGYSYSSKLWTPSYDPDYWTMSGVLSRAGAFEEVKTSSELKRRLESAGSHLPIGTLVRTFRIYHATRGYEPGRPRPGSIDQEKDLELVDRGSFYDPKTGRPRPPRWRRTTT
jgi:hypothetical protein